MFRAKLWGCLGACLGLGCGLFSKNEKLQIIIYQYIKRRNNRNYLIPKYHSPKPAAWLGLVCSCLGAWYLLFCTSLVFLP